MSELIICLANGRRVAFDVNLDSREPACFVLGIRKCGSTLINNMCRMMIDMNRRHYVAADVFFQANIREKEWSDDPAICALLHAGNIYGGFRMMPAAFADHPTFRDGPKVLMVRDPRDALVSEYFSLAYSHPVPQRSESGFGMADLIEQSRKRALQSGIDQMVLQQAPGMRSTFLGYTKVAGLPGTITVKYEDYVFRKADLIKILADQFGMIVRPAQVEELLQTFDEKPTIEDPKAFVRRVTPGDHREKLTAPTISKLNEILRPAMAAFGYAVE